LTIEIVGNLHCHTHYSDGYGTHNDIARAAIEAGLDFVVITDHNVWVDGMDGYRFLGRKHVLLLTGEEIHDQDRQPQKNHLLVYEAGEELAGLAHETQSLLDSVQEHHGLAFLAHPKDPPAPAFNQEDLSWDDWNVQGFNGIELWNFMSEFKSKLTSRLRAIFLAYNPNLIAEGPFPEVLERWDRMLSEGKQIYAIGGSDAHGTPLSMGPLKRVVFPYEYLFKAVNTHVLLDEALSGDMADDRQKIFRAIRNGRCFVGYDLPAPTRGFRFSAFGDRGEVLMGGRLNLGFGATLQTHLPRRAHIRLIKDGQIIQNWSNTQSAVLTVREPGAYRVEVHIQYLAKWRSWICSNPIFIH
jgi:hypothetical protein